MPALNEEEGLEGAVMDTLAALDESRVVGELIVVDDGSSDATGTLADRLARGDERISVIHHPRPMGIGRSFWDGVRQAQCGAVVMYPGDNEMLPAEMLLYLDELHNVDVVVPFIANAAAARSRMRTLTSAVYMALVRGLLGLKVHHSNGLVVYRRSVLQDTELRENGFLYQTELLAKTIGRGYLYAEVPYFIRPRQTGQSKAGGVISTLKILMRLVSLAVAMRSYRGGGPIDPSSATARRYARVGHELRKATPSGGHA